MTTSPVMTVTDELLEELESRVTSWKCKDHMAIKTLDAAMLIAEFHRLRAENAELAKSLAESRANDQAAMGWLTSLRWASGDRGERMLPELVTHIELMAKDAGRYRFLRDKEAERGPSVVDIACWTAGATCIALTYVDADDVDGAVDIAMAAQ